MQNIYRKRNTTEKQMNQLEQCFPNQNYNHMKRSFLKESVNSMSWRVFYEFYDNWRTNVFFGIILIWE